MYLVYIVTICSRAGHHILVISGCPEGVLLYQGMTDVLPMFGHLGCLSVVNVLNHDFNSLATYSDTELVNHRVIILQFLKNLHTILEVTALSYTPISCIARYKATFPYAHHHLVSTSQSRYKNLSMVGNRGPKITEPLVQLENLERFHGRTEVEVLEPLWIKHVREREEKTTHQCITSEN